MHKRRHYIYPDLDTLAAAFICDVNRFLHETASQEKSINIAISGGSTPLSIFRQLAMSELPGEWKHVNIYWVDERCVPSSDEQSNYGNASRVFLKPVSYPAERIFRIRGEADPDQEAERYGQLLLDSLPLKNGFPVFDWIWLGLGADGHTASIFPDQIGLWNSKRPCVVARHPETGQKRISINGGVINAARRVAFLVAGQDKSNVVNEIVMKEGDYLSYPAFYVAPHSGYIEWYLDMEATSWM